MKSFLKTFTGAEQLEIEKSRLEAFLSAVPGEYCGFSTDGTAIYSQGFLDYFGLKKIETVHDIQGVITHDGLVSSFQELRETRKSFLIKTQKKLINNTSSNAQKQFFEIEGTCGEAITGNDHFYILWVRDVSQQQQDITALEGARENAEIEGRKLQAISDKVPIGLSLRDEHGKLTWCNLAYANYAEESPADIVISQNELKVKFKDKKNSLKELAEAARQSGKRQREKAYIVSGGKRKPVMVNQYPFGNPVKTLGLIVDIAREEELEVATKRHLSANQTLLEQLRSAIAIFGSEQQLEFYNSAFAQLWGLEDQWLNTNPTLGEILEQLRETRRLPEQADFRSYKKTWLDMFTNLIDPHEDMLYLPDDSALRFLIIPHPMGGLMMTFEDVSSRLQLESSYNTLIAVQKETLDNLTEGVAVFGSDGRLKLFNPSYSQLWGLHPEDMEGEPHVTTLVNKKEVFFTPEEWEDCKEQLIGHAIQRSIQEGRIDRADDILIEYTTVPLPDGGVLVSYYDATDSVKVEKALREKNAALEQAEKLKTDFLANVSYQLRTPLNAVMGFAEILHNEYFGTLNDKQKEYSSSIQDAGERLVHLIDDILDLATIEAGYLNLTPEEFDVYQTLNGLYELSKEWGLQKHITVEIDCPKDIGTLIADQRRIKQILLNLIHNSINFTPEKGQIWLCATKNEETNQIIITVRDTGIGIKDEDMSRIFEPFERMDDNGSTEKRKDISSNALLRGAGLGLSIVKNITELHGGSVSIESEIDQGTAVHITLPIETVL